MINFFRKKVEGGVEVCDVLELLSKGGVLVDVRTLAIEREPVPREPGCATCG